MRIADSDIEAWIRPLAGKQGAAWPAQRTLHGILRGGELHRFEHGAHVLACRVSPGADAHLISTSRLLEEGLAADERAFVKDLLAAWSPPTVWLAWLQRNTQMQQAHETLIATSGLRTVTRKRIRGWAISVSVTMDQLEALIRG
jgi:hypothetical protein